MDFSWIISSFNYNSPYNYLDASLSLAKSSHREALYKQTYLGNSKAKRNQLSFTKP